MEIGDLVRTNKIRVYLDDKNKSFIEYKVAPDSRKNGDLFCFIFLGCPAKEDLNNGNFIKAVKDLTGIDLHIETTTLKKEMLNNVRY